MKKITREVLFREPEATILTLLGRRALQHWLYIQLLLLGLLPRPAGAQAHPASTTSKPGSERAIFLKVVVNRPNAYVGQPLTVSYLLFHRVPVIDPDDEVALKFNNCYVEEYPQASKQRTANIGGHVYQVQLIKKYLLIPQLEGNLQIPALTRLYRSSGPPTSEDFFGEQKIISTTVRSTVLQFPVRALPPLPPGDSVDFCGAVGLFRFRPTYTVSRKADNLLTVRLKVSGSGNLKNMKLPPPLLPGGVDFFNEFHRDQHTLSAKGLQAEGTYSYDVLANYQGTYTLSGIRLHYFDPESGRYLTYTAPAFHWRVTKGLPPHTTLASVVAETRPSLIKSELFGSQAGHLFFGSRIYYGLLFFAGLFFLTGIAYAHWVNARSANNRSYQFRIAKSQALLAIKKNERAHFQDADLFYKGLHDILLHYLCVKIGWDENEFFLGHLPAALQPFAIPASLQDHTLDFLGVLLKLRFSVSGPSIQSSDMYSEKLSLIIKHLDAHLNDQAHRPVAVSI